ncbi:MAG: translational GTPase TypA [Deltaproteobacteria bacterium]|nr:translational GTPase TypA [Deltaproteobacteria bacterium]MBI3293940.1 translational GTPase TypA [Deltaproteobacteria bacterium]
MINDSIRNIAIIAHVDHGKTTLVDGLLWQSGLFRDNQVVSERAMDSIDLERERGITLVAKNAAITYKGKRINIVDTPGHSDFGGEVERGIQMVDGALLLVDAAEGPLPQTRFVLRHALARDLKIITVINKIDRSDARPAEVLDEIYGLFLDLDAKDHQIDFPIIYTNARKRIAVKQPTDTASDLSLLFDAIIEHIPGPTVDDGPLSILISNTSYNDFLGRLAVGKIHSGSISMGQKIVLSQETGLSPEKKITALFHYQGMDTKPIEKAEAGDIVIVAGIEELRIGDSITDFLNPRPLPRIPIEEPTISIEMMVNTSPLAGRDGNRLTSRVLWDRLEKELRTNVSIRCQKSDASDTMIIKGRGELQFAILAEQMRREGYEFMFGRPRILTRTVNGQVQEPIEHLVLDIPDTCVGSVTEKLGLRKGEMTNMVKLGGNRVRIEFTVPSRGLIGYRSEVMNDTRGLGLISSYVTGWIPWRGHILERVNGALVADRAGQTIPYAIFHLESRGKMVSPAGIDVYEGMIVGIHNKTNDLNINVCREKKLTNIRAAGSDENVILTPVQPLTLEWCIAWIADDECVEVTPNHLRLRKKVLDQNKRSIIRVPKEDEE